MLQRVAQARYRDDDDLYKLAARTAWETLIRCQETLRVDVTAMRSPLRSLNFATLRVKDGIVDRLRDQTGERPSIDTRSPGSRVFAFLDERNVTLYLDYSGASLFKRGWRSGAGDKGEAPLKENLAAGLLALTGWQPEVPLYDPFCGSGTIVIEAAQIAAGIAPGLSRGFGFERHMNFDAALWSALRNSAIRQAQATTVAPRIAASDIDAAALAQTRLNLQRAGVRDGTVRLQQVDFRHASAPFDSAGLIVSNPPYGERVSLQSSQGDAGDFGAFSHSLKQHFAGWTACFLSNDAQLPRQLGMKEKRKTPLFNGPIECRLFCFEVRAGGQPQASPGEVQRP